MKQVYENQVANTKSNSSSNTSSIERQRIKTVSMKEKFEKGDFTTENEIEFKERLRREIDEELNFVHEADTEAKDAKNKFKELQKSNSFQQTTNLKSAINDLNNSNNNLNSNNSTPRPTPTHHPKVSTYKKTEQPIEIVKGSEPGQKEEVHINVNQLQERYRFFENQLNNQNDDQQKINKTEAPRRPTQLPKPIDDLVFETPNDEIKRDPNVVRSSDVIDDRPKNDIAKKMLNVFQKLEKSNSDLTKQDFQKPPKRCITPPQDFRQPVDDEVDSHKENGNLDIVRSSYKDDDVIPVEPEITKNLKAKFENWSSFEKETRKNSRTDSLEEIPQNEITKTLRSKFESIQNDKTIESVNNKIKVNRFVEENVE